MISRGRSPWGGYPERTRANARDSDATVWFGNLESSGGRTTRRAFANLGMLVFVVIDGLSRPWDVAAWIEVERVRVLNVAGSQDSRAPGIGARVEAFMLAVLRRLGHGSNAGIAPRNTLQCPPLPRRYHSRRASRSGRPRWEG
jgi:hypothetical protein